MFTNGFIIMNETKWAVDTNRNEWENKRNGPNSLLLKLNLSRHLVLPRYFAERERERKKTMFLVSMVIANADTDGATTNDL